MGSTVTTAHGSQSGSASASPSRSASSSVQPPDYSAPPATPPFPSHSPRRSPPGSLKAALADLDRALVLQRRVVKRWRSLGTLAEARRRRRELIKAAIEILDLTIDSMQKAVALSPADLKVFLARQAAQRKETRGLSNLIKASQKKLRAQPGGDQFFRELKQAATLAVRGRARKLVTLGKRLLTRKSELSP